MNGRKEGRGQGWRKQGNRKKSRGEGHEDYCCRVSRGLRVGAGEAILPVPQAFGHFIKTDMELNGQHHTTEDRQ